MVDKVAVNDSLTIAVFENWLAENFRGVERGRGSQRDFHGVEIFDNIAIFALIVTLVAERNFVVSKFTIENVTAMSLTTIIKSKSVTPGIESSA